MNVLQLDSKPNYCSFSKLSATRRPFLLKTRGSKTSWEQNRGSTVHTYFTHTWKLVLVICHEQLTHEELLLHRLECINSPANNWFILRIEGGGGRGGGQTPFPEIDHLLLTPDKQTQHHWHHTGKTKVCCLDFDDSGCV